MLGPVARRLSALIAVSGAVIALATPSLAACGPDATPTDSCPPAYADPEAHEPPVRIGGGVRGAGSVDVQVVALAPDHTGLTAEDQPTLYWFVSQAVPLRLEFTIVETATPKPVLDQTIEQKALAGIHALRLAAFGVRLKPDVAYRWFVSIVTDEEARSSDILASGTIIYRPPSATLMAQIAKTDVPRVQASLYARAGIWYDAIDAISRAIDAAPDDKALRQDRAALLRQVGLSAAASYDLSRE